MLKQFFDILSREQKDTVVLFALGVGGYDYEFDTMISTFKFTK